MDAAARRHIRSFRKNAGNLGTKDIDLSPAVGDSGASADELPTQQTVTRRWGLFDDSYCLVPVTVDFQTTEATEGRHHARNECAPGVVDRGACLVRQLAALGDVIGQIRDDNVAKLGQQRERDHRVMFEYIVGRARPAEGDAGVRGPSESGIDGTEPVIGVSRGEANLIAWRVDGRSDRNEGFATALRSVETAAKGRRPCVRCTSIVQSAGAERCLTFLGATGLFGP